MGTHRKKSPKPPRTIHPRQGQLVDVSWQNYLPEDIGTIVLSALDAGRGVFIGVTPSKELLTLRVYHDHGYTPLYGRSFGELYGRVQKIRGIRREIERSERNTGIPPLAEVPQPVLHPLTALWGIPHELALQFDHDHEQRALWVASQPPLRTRLATCRKSPPPLN